MSTQLFVTVIFISLWSYSYQQCPNSCGTPTFGGCVGPTCLCGPGPGFACPGSLTCLGNSICEDLSGMSTGSGPPSFGSASGDNGPPGFTGFPGGGDGSCAVPCVGTDTCISLGFGFPGFCGDACVAAVAQGTLCPPGQVCSSASGTASCHALDAPCTPPCGGQTLCFLGECLSCGILCGLNTTGGGNPFEAFQNIGFNITAFTSNPPLNSSFNGNVGAGACFSAPQGSSNAYPILNFLGDATNAAVNLAAQAAVIVNQMIAAAADAAVALGAGAQFSTKFLNITAGGGLTYSCGSNSKLNFSSLALSGSLTVAGSGNLFFPNICFRNDHFFRNDHSFGRTCFVWLCKLGDQVTREIRRIR